MLRSVESSAEFSIDTHMRVLLFLSAIGCEMSLMRSGTLFAVVFHDMSSILCLFACGVKYYVHKHDPLLLCVIGCQDVLLCLGTKSHSGDCIS